MSADEIEEARKAIKKLMMPDDERRTRRFAPGGRRFRIDARRSFRRLGYEQVLSEICAGSVRSALLPARAAVSASELRGGVL